MSALDTLVSAHSLSTAFGRTVAYTALYEGTSFATLSSTTLYKTDDTVTLTGIPDILSTKQYPLPSPTILFLTPRHLTDLTTAVVREAEKSVVFRLAWRHKLAGIIDGYMNKDSLWDRLVFEGARTKVLGEGAATLRGLVVSGGIDSTVVTPTRIALSVPFVNAFTHPVVAAPIFASHPLDLQTFAPSANAHVGPPVINVETKLTGVEDDVVEKGGDPVGHLHVRGPIVGRILTVSDNAEPEQKDQEEPWVPTGYKSRAQTNGSFKVWPLVESLSK
ncbi:hypothetical protein HETIRDRAFT_407493 [Heterobasidion irregulare TC 32-1]|uniref:Uncharacterized protein n=1 Tax=Heterobasidion irregulare (strain TC 32-1) TaxID=747525 RepID=W4KHW5_HETIT|nr:uncharacterized protein HETIRDRAFT_407493 [Heterobasidion irregulare TC 32-1]ETW85453.1 hypothetical protein HETIRDRAFT_407493 [Heterobasidion irregulare TC 32-1]